MELKEIEKEILVKCATKEVSYILTSNGFINNCGLTEGEIKLLHELAKELKQNDFAILLNGKIYTPYMTDYNNGYILAGIKIYSILS